MVVALFFYFFMLLLMFCLVLLIFCFCFVVVVVLVLVLPGTWSRRTRASPWHSSVPFDRVEGVVVSPSLLLCPCRSTQDPQQPVKEQTLIAVLITMPLTHRYARPFHVVVVVVVVVLFFQNLVLFLSILVFFKAVVFLFNATANSLTFFLNQAS